MAGLIVIVLGVLALVSFASYPTANVHRVSRRKLGRGQYPGAAGVAATITATGSVATLTFAAPVVISGTVPFSVAGGPTFVSQSVTSPTVMTQTFSAALSGHAYTLPSNANNVRTPQGGVTIGESGTFS